MSSSWAAPGVKCVCKNSHWRKTRGLPFWQWIGLLTFGPPIRGGVYVITRVLRTDWGEYVTLKGYGTCAFHISNFKPLIDPKQQRDIAIFTPLLDPSLPLVLDPVTAGPID